LPQVGALRQRPSQLHAHHTWRTEQDNQTGKDQLGLGAYQVRKYTPWYRHVTLAMLAAAFLTVTRTELGKDPVSPQQDTAA
jgi:SRSO17 transposase